MYQNLEKQAKELNLMQRELDKRRQALNVNIQEKKKLKRMHD
jgi:phage anti-repressor protein